MKLIVTGDWHLDAMTAGHSRLPEQKSVLRQLLHRVQECLTLAHGKETVVVAFLGDLCNPERGSRTLAAITEGAWAFNTMVELGAKVLAIAGNHDVTDSAEVLTTLSPMRKAIQGMVVAEVPQVLMVDDRLQFMFLPYMAPPALDQWSRERVLTPTQWAREHCTTDTVVLGHLSIEGAMLGSETLDMPRGRDNAFPITETQSALLRLNGHYHKRQSPHGIWCPGSMVRLAFGEESNPVGWLEWSL